MKNNSIYIIVIIILLAVNLCAEEKNISSHRYFYITGELGAGHYAYAGAGYDLAGKLQLFNNFQYFKSIGFLFGFTYLNEDSVYIYEPDVFITGEIVNNKIQLSKNNSLDVDWRLKAGKMFIESTEYQMKAEAMTYGIDFLFKAFRYFFVDVSLPFVRGDEGTELAPCVSLGLEYRIF